MTVGSSANWTVGETGTPLGGPLFPDAAIGGANVQTDSYSVTNNDSGSQNLTSVVISVATSNGSAWSSQTDLTKPACDASDFSIDGAAVGTSVTDTALHGDFTAGPDEEHWLCDCGTDRQRCESGQLPGPDRPAVLLRFLGGRRVDGDQPSTARVLGRKAGPRIPSVARPTTG